MVANAAYTLFEFDHQTVDDIANCLDTRIAPSTVEPMRDGGHQLSMSGRLATAPGFLFGHVALTGAFSFRPHGPIDSMMFIFGSTGTMSWRRGGSSAPLAGREALAIDGLDLDEVSVGEDPDRTVVKIGRQLFIERVSVLLEEPVRRRITFEPLLDTAGRSHPLAMLAQILVREDVASALGNAPGTASRLLTSLVDLALETWPNSLTELLTKKPPLIAPRHVKLAIQSIHDNIDNRLTPEELAALCGVSLRALQNGFRHFMGTSIVAYQRRVRLERARADILGDPTIAVETVALRWGFTNAGRFSRYFKDNFGVFPSELMRNGRPRQL